MGIERTPIIFPQKWTPHSLSACLLQNGLRVAAAGVFFVQTLFEHFDMTICLIRINPNTLLQIVVQSREMMLKVYRLYKRNIKKGMTTISTSFMATHRMSKLLHHLGAQTLYRCGQLGIFIEKRREFLHAYLYMQGNR